jgi:hypothetical protein
MCLFPTEWHQDEASLSWLDALLDKEYRGGIAKRDLSTHIRARELVDLMRAQMGSRNWRPPNSYSTLRLTRSSCSQLMPITDQRLSEGRDSDEADIKRPRYRYEGCFLREKTDELINPETIGSCP